MADKQPIPLFWKCDCGWVGTANQAINGCPECGNNSLRIFIVGIVDKPEPLIDPECMS